ncbi:hypothetical protein QBC46DRAFT_355681 [Diplogelasinospora grovesii]|uniref:Ecp2 effector protein-like domain-containing protein n=1 Tax=Diplogelasinospora grovesii TaxID=303347 RepID=A0AAN6S3M3_9PEZI|nr:hypothetical protein QBC46DRAFT_355681 [Diplogelasinospora grovesii]
MARFACILSFLGFICIAFGRPGTVIHGRPSDMIVHPKGSLPHPIYYVNKFKSAIHGRGPANDTGPANGTVTFTKTSTDNSLCNSMDLYFSDIDEHHMSYDDCKTMGSEVKDSHGYWQAYNQMSGNYMTWTVLASYESCQFSVMRLNGNGFSKIGNTDVSNWVTDALNAFGDKTAAQPVISTSYCPDENAPYFAWRMSKNGDP